jgi:hypothetical protein
MVLSDVLLPSLYKVAEKSRYFRIKIIYQGWPNILNTGAAYDNIQMPQTDVDWAAQGFGYVKGLVCSIHS